MRSAQIVQYGDFVDAVQCVEMGLPSAPGPAEALIEIIYAPVNFNDLLLLSGKFPVHPPLPATAGNEGVGRVVAVGSDVYHIGEGDIVIPPLYSGTWREQMIVPADELFALPDGIDLRQAAMARINPPTAALLLTQYANLSSGDWIVQNAANSGVGRSVIAFARDHGFKTLNLVRRAGAAEEMISLGGDAVLVDQDLTPGEVSEATGGAPIKLALDGVCGDATARLAGMLGRDGVLVGYAQMSGQKTAPGDLRTLMTRNVRTYDFYQNAPRFRPLIPTILRQAIDLIASGRLQQQVSATFPLDEVKAAVAHTRDGGRALLEIASGRA